MDPYVIQIQEHLTSYRFYHELLPQLHTYARLEEKKPILFDFTETRSVSPLVIPNLLCVGYIICENYGHKPTVFVPDNLSCEQVKDYLHEINFVNLAREYGLFEFTASIDYRKKKRIIGQLCSTREFNHSSDRDGCENMVRERVSDFFGGFFATYLSEAQEQAGYDQKIEAVDPYSDLEDKCAQLITNSLEHGRSFAFMTTQVNHTRGKVYISVADCGIGFKSCINEQIRKREEPFQSRTKEMEDETEAVVNAIFVRAEEKNNKIYGLYPLIMQVLKKGGTVRIHSVDTQLILTPQLMIELDVAADKRKSVEQKRDSLLNLLRGSKNNVSTNVKCGGSHIEIELPLEGGMYRV